MKFRILNLYVVHSEKGLVVHNQRIQSFTNDLKDLQKRMMPEDITASREQ